MSATSYAQLVFVDANGKEIANGATLTMDEAVVDPDWGDVEVDLKGLSVKNTSGSTQTFQMNATVKSIPNGSFSCCFGTNCRQRDSEGVLELKNLSISGNKTVNIANTEWYPEEEGAYGTTSVELSIVDGPSVNINFVYSNPMGIKDVATAAMGKIVAIYNVSGKRIPAMTKGINLVKYSNGIVKKIIK